MFSPILSIVLSIVKTDMFWRFLAGLVVLVALYFFYRQVYQQKLIAAFRFVSKISEDFYNKNNGKNKSLFAKVKLRYKDDLELIDNHGTPICDIFEELGLLFKKKVIPNYIMWTYFSTEILYWWTILKDTVFRIRKQENDLSIYIEFEYLYNRIYKLENRYRKKLLKQKITLPDSKKLEKFLKEELSISYDNKIERHDFITLTELDRLSFNEFDRYKNSDFKEAYDDHSEGFFKIQAYNEKIIGYYIFHLETPEVCYIQSIAIEPSYRGLGISKEALKRIKFRAKDLGCKKITLHVDEQNYSAIKLYTGFGFVQTGVEKNYYDSKDNALVLEYNLKN